jgi:hypothetical protein
VAERGQESGQLSWGEYVDELVAAHGSLAAVAERLCESRGWSDEVASVERALRRLRRRGTLPGGRWGQRLVRRFGLPGSIEDRLRFLGTYHSRFVDLPLGLCADLVRSWDRPPTSESRLGRLWLALARASLALRARAFDLAAAELGRAELSDAPLDARAEHGLVAAYLASRDRVDEVVGRRDEVAPVVEQVGSDDERACLRVRWVNQRAYEWNRVGDYAAAERLYLDLPDDGPAFARSRRANGLAYARLQLGDPEGALQHARDAARYAGDAGHARLRALALAMIARIDDGPEGRDARARAIGIARTLGDDALLSRVRGPKR